MTIKVYKASEIKENCIIPSGADRFVGADEKRRNKEIVHIELPFTFGNYMLFYAGTNKILKKAVAAMVRILNGEGKRQEKEDYKILIESLHIVHHVSSETRHSKLDGINSLSTSCTDNLFCLKRIASGDSVCAHCYSATQQKQQLALQDRNTINGIILRNIVIPTWAWKKYFKKVTCQNFSGLNHSGTFKIRRNVKIILISSMPSRAYTLQFGQKTSEFGIWLF